MEPRTTDEHIIAIAYEYRHTPFSSMLKKISLFTGISKSRIKQILQKYPTLIDMTPDGSTFGYRHKPLAPPEYLPIFNYLQDYPEGIFTIDEIADNLKLPIGNIQKALAYFFYTGKIVIVIVGSHLYFTLERTDPSTYYHINTNLSRLYKFPSFRVQNGIYTVGEANQENIMSITSRWEFYEK